MSLLDAGKTRPLEGGASFSLGNRIARAIWGLTWAALARPTPPPMHGWRRFLLRSFGAKVAKGARVHASVKVWLPANLDLGENCLIGPEVNLYNQGHIRIGAKTVISQGSHICASTHDIGDPLFQLQLRPITIGDQCWVASEAFVGPGVTMGDRSVLAARGALFRHAEADGVYSGNPAAYLKPRNLRAER